MMTIKLLRATTWPSWLTLPILLWSITPLLTTIWPTGQIRQTPLIRPLSPTAPSIASLPTWLIPVMQVPPWLTTYLTRLTRARLVTKRLVIRATWRILLCRIPLSRRHHQLCLVLQRKLPRHSAWTQKDAIELQINWHLKLNSRQQSD